MEQKYCYTMTKQTHKHQSEIMWTVRRSEELRL